MKSTEYLKLGVIRADQRIQPRAEINFDVVEEYTEAWENGSKFPSIVVFFDGQHFWLADGFHRYEAARCACRNAPEFEEIEAVVRHGGMKEAKIYAAQANKTHGLRRTNEDKRRAVMLLLEYPEWREMSDHRIASHCGVSHTFVGKIREEATSNGFQSPTRRVGADNRSIDTGRIGKKQSGRRRSKGTSTGETYELELLPPEEIALSKLCRLIGFDTIDPHAVATACEQPGQAQELAAALDALIPWLMDISQALISVAGPLSDAKYHVSCPASETGTAADPGDGTGGRSK